MRRMFGTSLPIVIAMMVLPGIPPVSAAPFQSEAPALQLAQRGPPGQPRFEERGNYALYNGYRGYRRHHPGYRQYQGYWFPPAAFAGAVIGGAIMNGLLNGAQPRQQDYPAYEDPYGEPPDGSGY